MEHFRDTAFGHAMQLMTGGTVPQLQYLDERSRDGWRQYVEEDKPASTWRYGQVEMIWSPLSEIPQVGRNPVYIGTLFVFFLLQIPTATSSSFGMLLAFRFISGFVGSPVLATGGATLVDIWSPKKRAYPIACWGIAAVAGPTLGPVVGGFAAMSKGWTWPIWELMWLSGLVFILLFFCLPETSSTNILYRRAKRLRKITGNDKIKSEPEVMAEDLTGKEIVVMCLVRPLTLNFAEPMVFLLNLYIALIYGLLYIWFESFPVIFTGIYGFSPGMQGLAFLGIMAGAFVAIPPFFWYLHKHLEPQFDENGDIQPEKRLPPAFVGAFAIPLCLFWFGWSARADVHWIVPVVGSAWFSVGSTFLFNSVLNYLPDAYPACAASVLAGNDLFRSAFGASFPLFANTMYERLGVN
ncbi:Caffeine resistance protein 5 [Colletotrichum shisoi]|uniref:Caffeine resistance protein 5 n=1 Tax=Colletotrichum shisoi TaxID=2078593 RepID=A0A5Q4BLM2_9PEZI|nr:Caffeine resistance protein 5 [Colletotrichum shisoi]